MSGLKLDHKQTINLINLHREYDCLWDFRSPNYKSNDLKRKAWAEIGKIFKCTGEDIKKKVKYLRTAYVVEKKKSDDSKRSGEVYQSSLFYFNDFNYLDNTIVLRKPDANYEEFNNSCNDSRQEGALFEDPLETETNTEDGASLPTAINCKRKKTDKCDADVSKIDNAMEAIINFATKNVPAPPPVTENMYDIFGKSIGVQLKNLPRVNAARAMAQIQEIITEHTISVLQGQELIYTKLEASEDVALS